MKLTAMSRSERGSRSARWRSPRYDRYTDAAEIPLLALSVLLIPVLVLPEISKLGSAERAGLDVIDYGVWAVFIADYLTDSDSRATAPPSSAGTCSTWPSSRCPCSVRFAWLGPPVWCGSHSSSPGRTDRRRRALQTRAVAYVNVLAATLTLACSVAILEFEQHAPSANIRTYGDALWWAVTTVSTVGYGDRYPVTLGGRVTAVLLIGAGVSLFGVITAAVAAYFIRRLHPPRHQRPRPRRGRPARPARTAASRRHPHRERSGHRNPAARGLPVTVNIRAETIRAAGVVADRWATRCQAVAALSAGVTSAASDARSRPRTSPRAATVKKAGVAMRPVSIFRKVSTGTPAAAATSTMLRSPRA
jgi:voltage-gated potassium channel